MTSILTRGCAAALSTAFLVAGCGQNHRDEMIKILDLAQSFEPVTSCQSTETVDSEIGEVPSRTVTVTYSVAAGASMMVVEKNTAKSQVILNFTKSGPSADAHVQQARDFCEKENLPQPITCRQLEREGLVYACHERPEDSHEAILKRYTPRAKP